MSTMFFMPVRDQIEDAITALKQVRVLYPTSTFLMYMDGAINSHHALISECRVHGAVLISSGYQSFAADMGGVLPQVMLELFVRDSNDTHLLKIDPDTAVLDTLPPYPADDRCIFGRRQQRKGAWSIQGGCMGFTRKAAQILCESALLVDKRLHPPYEGLPDKYAEILRERAERLGLSSFDWTIGWVCTELGIEQVNWTEKMYCYHKGPIPEGPWKLIHPFKWTKDSSDG